MNNLNVSAAATLRFARDALCLARRSALAATAVTLGIAVGTPATAQSFWAGALGLTSYTDPMTGNTMARDETFDTADKDALVDASGGYTDGPGLGRTAGFAMAVAGDRYVRALAGSMFDGAYAPRGLGAFDYGTGFILSPTGYVGGALGIGRAEWSTIVHPSGSGNASAGANLYRKLEFRDSLSLSDRIADMQQAVVANGLPAYNPVTTDPIQFLNSLVQFRLNILENETGAYWGLSWTDYLERRLELRTNGVFLNQGAASWSDVYACDDLGNCTSNTTYYPIDSLTTPPNSPSDALGFERNDPYLIPTSFSSSNSYTVSLSLYCGTFIFLTPGAATSPPQMSASCDASKSGYWTGLSDFSDADGNPIAPFGLIDLDTGLDISGASPAYLPGGVTPVPEPAQWTLLIAGFGLVGGAARRRRLLAAGA